MSAKHDPRLFLFDLKWRITLALIRPTAYGLRAFSTFAAARRGWTLRIVATAPRLMSYFSSSTAYLRTTLTALSRCGARSAQAFDL